MAVPYLIRLLARWWSRRISGLILRCGAARAYFEPEKTGGAGIVWRLSGIRRVPRHTAPFAFATKHPGKQMDVPAPVLMPPNREASCVTIRQIRAVSRLMCP